MSSPGIVLVDTTPSATAEHGMLSNGEGKTPVANKVNILLVDDRDDKILALEAVLSALGQNVIKARSGKDALRLLLKHEFAVILLDVSMPVMDGFETAALIRKRPATEHTPIIFITSINASENSVYRGYSLGAVDYILTPIVPEVLRAKVSVFVELYLKTEQIRQQSERLLRIEEMEHQRRLAEARDQLEAETRRNRFFNLSLDLLGIANFDGYFLQCNPSWEKCLGFTEEELKRRSGLELVHPEDRNAMELQMEGLKLGASTTYFEGRYQCKDGSYRWLGWTAAPFPAEKLIYIFARDITARKDSEEKIRKLNLELEKRVDALTEINKELEAFNYSISHDLRAPLRSMKSFAQVLIEDFAANLPAEAQDYLQRIIRSARYMDTMLHDLLTYSRLTRTEMVPTRIRLDTVVQEVVSYSERDIKDKNARVEITMSETYVMGHLPTVKQIIANLISNALKFVARDRQPNIRIHTSTQNNLVRLWVEDNGIGIEPQYSEKIFGLFERLNPNDEYPGTGIGLALVRKGVERMGGRVGVLSDFGSGSRFWVDFPLSEFSS